MVYRVGQRITMGEASATLAEGDAALEQGEVEFSLEHLGGSDSAALAVLLAWQRRARQRDRPLTFIDVPPTLATLAGLYGLGPILSGFPHVASGGAA